MSSRCRRRSTSAPPSSRATRSTADQRLLVQPPDVVVEVRAVGDRVTPPAEVESADHPDDLAAAGLRVVVGEPRAAAGARVVALAGEAHLVRRLLRGRV